MLQLMEDHPKFMRPIINDLVNLFTEILSTKQFCENLRIAALEGVVILA